MPTREQPLLNLAATWLDQWEPATDPPVRAPLETHQLEHAEEGLPAAPLPRRAPVAADAPTFRCPRCEAVLVRSHRRFYERPLKYFVKRRPYRCLGCGRRSWF